MVWYCIGVYIINRISHGHVEIQHFTSHVEKKNLPVSANKSNIFQRLKRNFVSPQGHVISSMSLTLKIKSQEYPKRKKSCQIHVCTTYLKLISAIGAIYLPLTCKFILKLRH